MAFPTTSVLDSFNRADENPVSNGGKWTNAAFPGDGNLKVATNVLARAGASWSSAYWSNATFGPDSEVYATWNASSPVELILRIASPGTSGVDGYLLDITTSTWSTWRIDNNVQTQIGSNATQAMSSGDALGFEAIGSAIKAYRKPSGSAWTSTPVISVTDATYNAAGNIGAVLNTASTLDDFGGGTVATGGQTVTPTGLASAGSFGTLTPVPGGVSVSMTGLSSAGSFGSLTPHPGGVIVLVSALSSASQFGSATAQNMLVPVLGVPSAAAFGTPSIPGGSTFSPAIQGGHYS